MPRLARHKVTLAWFNDFVRGERSPGDVLKEVQKRGLNPADYEEVVVSLALYDTKEADFYAADRVALALIAAGEETAWTGAKTKLLALLGPLTAAERAALRKRLFQE
mgnify:CR=1 FL=1